MPADLHADRGVTFDRREDGMAVNTQISKAQAIEQELYSHADDGAAGNALAAVLSEYRKACEELLCASSEHIATYDTDHQLWQAHLRVNNAFRREHRVLQRSPDRVVEKRKFEKNYLHFIKASQTFYRQCILNLDARYSGIPKLRKIAQSWKQEAPKTSGSPSIPAALNEEVLVACHQILIHLGDLSRYRSMETEEAEKRKWGPAVGFYKLADELYPDSGHAHNQLAVISREDGDHFRSVYHLYRSLACKKPYAQAQGNLELEFKRIIGAWDKGQLINNHKSSDDQNAGQALIAWFIRLHSKLYKGEEFAAHDELEGEVLSHLAIELKERSLDAVLHKIILINLAAEYHATVQMQSTFVTSSPLAYANILRPRPAQEHPANVLLLPPPERQDLLRPPPGPAARARTTLRSRRRYQDRHPRCTTLG